MFCHHRTGRRPRTVLLALLVMFLATACGAGTTDPGGSAGGEGPTVRIALGVDGSYAPLYLAADRGMFEKAGLDVRLTKVEGGPAATQAVTAGTAQISANADSTALPQMVNNPRLRALGAFQSSGRYLEVVLREGITSPQAIGEISFEARALTSADVTSSRRIVDFLRGQGLIRSAPDLDTVLLRGWYDRYAR